MDDAAAGGGDALSEKVEETGRATEPVTVLGIGCVCRRLATAVEGGGARAAPRTVPGVEPALLALRAVIIVATARWCLSGHAVEAGVGAVCLALTFLPRAVTTSGDRLEVWLSMLMAAHVALGMGLCLYERSALYDKVVHLAAFAGLAALLATELRRYGSRHGLRLTAGLQAALVFAATLALGAGWEMFEFSLDRTGLFTTQRGLTDTMIDLFADIGGGALGLWAVTFRGRRVPRDVLLRDA